MQAKWLLFVVPLAMSVTNVHCSSELVPALQAAHSPTVSDSSPDVQSLFSVMAGVVCPGGSLLFGWRNRRGRSAEQVPDRSKNTQLHQAVECGQVEIVRGLLNAGASIEAVDKNARTPLMCAVEKGNLGITQALLDAGASVEADNEEKGAMDQEVGIWVWGRRRLTSDGRGKTPLMHAAYASQPEAMEMLLRHGANIEVLDGWGQSLLMLMAGEGEIGLVELLLNARADVDATSIQGKTPLMFAARFGHKAVVKLLLDAGANIEEADESGMTSLLWAARNGKEAIVRELLLRGAIFPATEAMAKLKQGRDIVEHNKKYSYQHRVAAESALEELSEKRLPIDLQNIVLNQMGHQRMSEQERQALAQLMMREAEE